MMDGGYITGASYTLPSINLNKESKDPFDMKFCSSVIANCLAGILTAVVLFGVGYLASHNTPTIKRVCDMSKDGQHHYQQWRPICNKYNADGSVGQERYCNDCGMIFTRVVYPDVLMGEKIFR